MGSEITAHVSPVYKMPTHSLRSFNTHELMHEKAVRSIADKMREFYETKEFRMFHGSTGSTRTPSHQGNMIDTSDLTHVLEINTEEKLVRVEPNVSMEQLVEITMEYNLIPPVVPEFRGLTVGG